MFAPWNEIRPKKYPSPGIPVVQLWQNPCNQSYPIPLGIYFSEDLERGSINSHRGWGFFALGHEPLPILRQDIGTL